MVQLTKIFQCSSYFGLLDARVKIMQTCWILIRKVLKFRLTNIPAKECALGTNYLRQPRYHCNVLHGIIIIFSLFIFCIMFLFQELSRRIHTSKGKFGQFCMSGLYLGQYWQQWHEILPNYWFVHILQMYHQDW